jgi:hypothetical protein
LTSRSVAWEGHGMRLYWLVKKKIERVLRDHDGVRVTLVNGAFLNLGRSMPGMSLTLYDDGLLVTGLSVGGIVQPPGLLRYQHMARVDPIDPPYSPDPPVVEIAEAA